MGLINDRMIKYSEIIVIETIINSVIANLLYKNHLII